IEALTETVRGAGKRPTVKARRATTLRQPYRHSGYTKESNRLNKGCTVPETVTAPKVHRARQVGCTEIMLFQIRWFQGSRAEENTTVAQKLHRAAPSTILKDESAGRKQLDESVDTSSDR